MNEGVRITDIDIPLGRLVVILLKLMLASIPAVLLFYIITFAVVLGVAAILGGLGALASI